jgi:hypothetical protein
MQADLYQYGLVGGERKGMPAMPGGRKREGRDWAKVRSQLLRSPVKDLGLTLKGSSLEAMVRKLYRELRMRRLGFMPEVYLTDSWGCPDRVPVMGVPFYLADPRLVRIEVEKTGEVENARAIMSFLRHEAGHAYNYAYRFFELREWGAVFGSFWKPYRESFLPEGHSKDFVRHLKVGGLGFTYAQKHPDEDFAETFAVWLTPGGNWRRKYRGWPAYRKLEYLDRLMGQIRGRSPKGEWENRKFRPVERLAMKVAHRYG